MTKKQQYQISEAITCILQARKWLDLAMYNSATELSEEEYGRIREAYDLICKANDKL